MSRQEKLNLFAKAIVQDFADTNTNLELFRYMSESINSNYMKNLSVYALLDDSDDNVDDDEDNLEIEETTHESLMKKYTDEEFFFYFHMKKTTFYRLVQEIKLNKHLLRMCNCKSDYLLQKSLLITLLYLAKGCEIIDIANEFDIARASILKILDVTIKIFCKMQDKLIVWPTEKQCESISISFLSKYKYPNIIGAIGNIHVKFKPPKDTEEIFRNQNMSHSLVLQGICNFKNEFTYIFAGFPGSLDCSTILKHSNFYKNIEETTISRYFYNRYHLVGNELYPLRSWLMTPFRSNELLTVKHARHNFAIESALEPIKKAFSILQQRWKILTSMKITEPEKICEIMEASCVLHNFCIRSHDLFEDGKHINFDEYVKNVDYLDVTNEGISKRMRYLNAFI